MAAIPTILRGDDSGTITLSLAAGRSYAGATLVVAFQGVTRTFTNLTAGGSVALSFTHDETAKFVPGCRPVLMRLVGQYGAEETVENAEARIKVTDCLADVNSGGTFVVNPGDQGASGKVPITDVGDVASRFTLEDLQAKVNQLVRVLAQRSLLLLCACCLLSPCSSTAATASWSANLGSLYNDTPVVTNMPEWAKDPNPPVSMTDNAVVYTNGSLKTKVGELVPVASTNEVAEVHDTVMSWEGFLDGSNVVFSITNYLSGSYRTDAAKLRILEMTNGVFHEVYNSRDEIALHLDDFRTNDLRVATNTIAAGVDAKISTFDAKIAEKAPKAWGRYSSSGVDIHSLGVTNAVYMTAPTTYFAGGYDWYRVSCGEGAVCVLTANGAAANTYVEDGTFYFQDLTTTNYFGFRTRDNFIIGCDADDIHTESNGVNRRVVIEYDIDADTCPILLYRPTLENFSSNSWEQLNDASGQPVAGATYAVTWTNDSDTYTAFVNVGTNAIGFFTARTVVQGEAEFVTNMKSDLKGGIVTTDGQHIIKPVYADGELTWRTFDYGSGIQVSTPSQGQVYSIASAKAAAATATYASYAETNFVDRAYVATNCLLAKYVFPTGWNTPFAVVTNKYIAFGGNTYSDGFFTFNDSTLRAASSLRGSTSYDPPEISFYDRYSGSGCNSVIVGNRKYGWEMISFGIHTDDNPLEYTYSDLFPDGSQVMTSNLTERAVKKLTGVTYDFQSGTNFTLRLYQTLTNIIDRLGGTVTNAPSFD